LFKVYVLQTSMKSLNNAISLLFLFFHIAIGAVIE
jgi:hypothetical protein